MPEVVFYLEGPIFWVADIIALLQQKVWLNPRMEDLPDSVLEVGANTGQNLVAFPMGADLYGVEPNKAARKQLQEVCTTYPDTATNILMDSGQVDLVFTCGVLIHISRKDLRAACSEIVRVSNRYVLAIEYFSDEPEEKEYRGNDKGVR